MKNKVTVIFGALVILSSSIFAQNFYTGNGGRGMRLEVEKPQVENVGSDVSWIPNFVANMVSDTIAKYSAIQIVDNYNEQRVVAARVRDESAAFDESAVLDAEGFAVAQNILNIAITGKSNSYSLSFRVTDKQTLAQKASHNNANCMYADLESGKALTAAVSDLLGQMGVTLTADAKKILSTPTTSETKTAQAQVNVARGLEAQRNGSNIEALTYYIKAMTSDKTLTRAVVATETVSAAVRTGNTKEMVKNRIKVMDEYAVLVKETKAYLETISPVKFFYTTNLYISEVDYGNETIFYGFRVYMARNKDYINICQTVYDAIKAQPDSDKWDKKLVNINDFDIHKKDKEWKGGIRFEIRDENGKLIDTKEKNLSFVTNSSLDYRTSDYDRIIFGVPIEKDVDNFSITIKSCWPNVSQVYTFDDMCRNMQFKLNPVEGLENAYYLTYANNKTSNDILEHWRDVNRLHVVYDSLSKRDITFVEDDLIKAIISSMYKGYTVQYFLAENKREKGTRIALGKNEIFQFSNRNIDDGNFNWSNINGVVRRSVNLSKYIAGYISDYSIYNNVSKVREVIDNYISIGSSIGIIYSGKYAGSGRCLFMNDVIEVSYSQKTVNIYQPLAYAIKIDAEAQSNMTPKELFNKYFVIAEWKEKGIYSVLLRPNVDKNQAVQFLRDNLNNGVGSIDYRQPNNVFYQDLFDYIPNKNNISFFPDEYKNLKPVTFRYDLGTGQSQYANKQGYVLTFAPEMTPMFNDYVLRTANITDYRLEGKAKLYEDIMTALPKLLQDKNAGDFYPKECLQGQYFNLIYIDESKINKKFISQQASYQPNASAIQGVAKNQIDIGNANNAESNMTAKDLFNKYFVVAEWQEKGIYSVLLRPNVDREEAKQFLLYNLNNGVGSIDYRQPNNVFYQDLFDYRPNTSNISFFPDEYKNLKPVTFKYDLKFDQNNKYANKQGYVLTFAPEMTPMFNDYVLRTSNITDYRLEGRAKLYEDIMTSLPMRSQGSVGGFFPKECLQGQYFNLIYIDENKIDKKFIDEKAMKQAEKEAEKAARKKKR